MKRLEGMDAMFLHTETASQYMHTLKVAIFEPPAGGNPYRFADQFEHIGTTIHRVPPFRWRAIAAPFNLHHPVWINDPDFDLGLHVHRAALPAPAGETELAEFIENIASTPLNRDRPLWELWMVENYLGNKVAAVSKVHHALADGVASAGMLQDFMTAQPGEDISSDQPYVAEQPPSRWRGFWWAVSDLLRDLLKIPAQITAVRAGKNKQQARQLSLDQKPPEPFSGPFTSLNQPISSHRKFSFFTVPLEDIKQLSKVFGVSLNDVVLNMAAHSVREFLRRRGELPEQALTASVPVSTRGPESVNTYGNKVGSLSVSLCTNVEDSIERLQLIHRSVTAAKLDFEDTRGGRIADFIGLLPPALVKAIGGYSRRLSEQGKSPSYNVIVSNVPGPRGALFDDTMAMSEFYSIGPILEGTGLNITAWSFQDKLSFSILSCYRAVSRPEEIKEGLLAGLEAMCREAELGNERKTA